MSCCTSLTHRPDLAYRITTHSLTMPAPTSLQADDLSRLTHALHLCVSLRNLSMLDGEPHFSGDAVQVWISQGHLPWTNSPSHISAYQRAEFLGEPTEPYHVLSASSVTTLVLIKL